LQACLPKGLNFVVISLHTSDFGGRFKFGVLALSVNEGGAIGYWIVDSG